MIEQMYQKSLIADAAYVNFGGAVGQIGSEFNDQFLNRGWKEEQIAKFRDDYQLVKQFDFVSGMSVSVFQKGVGGEKYIAFRGTQPTDTRDFVSDLMLALGYSVDWLDGVISPFSHAFSVGSFLHQIGAIDNYGQSVFDASYQIVGHSLGGHLAIMMGMVWPSLVQSIDTFNSAGVNPFDWAFLRARGLLLSPLDENLVNNYFGAAGPEAVATPLFQRPGDRQAIWIEDHGVIETHYQEHIFKSLSLYRIFTLLDASLDNEAGLSTLFNIFEGMANDGGVDVLETIFTHLERLSEQNSPTNDPQNLYQLIANAGTNQTIVDLTTLSAEQIADYAKSDTPSGMAVRYALENQLSFTMQVPSSLRAPLELDNFTAQYLEDRALYLRQWMISNLQNDDAASSDVNASFTDWETLTNFTTSTGINITSQQFYDFGSNAGDPIEGGDLNDHLYGMGGNDTISGGAGNDYIEGGSGNDVLTGGTSNDTLVGGTDDDQLSDGAGLNTLVGGDGNDTFVIDLSLNGNTTIRDDGGTLTIHNGADATGEITLMADGSNIYQRLDTNDVPLNDYIYKIIDKPDGSKNLTISNSTGASIIIENWTNGKFGITAIEEAPVAEVGDFYELIDGTQFVGQDVVDAAETEGYTGPNPWFPWGGSYSEFPWPTVNNYIHDTYGVGVYYDASVVRNSEFLLFDGVPFYDLGATFNGNMTMNASSRGWAGSGYMFMAGPLNDVLLGSHFKDALIGREGNDIIYGDGYEAVGGDDDFLIGGLGSDTIVGGIGHDVLMSAYSVDIDPMTWEGLPPADDDQGDSDFLFGDEGNDILVGERGQDRMDGGADNDLIMGGDNRDRLTGGAGNDVIVGDSTLSADEAYRNVSGNWVKSVQVGVRQATVESTLSVDDEIDGGAGDDKLAGELGNDVLKGGEGNDIIYGDLTTLGFVLQASNPRDDWDFSLGLDGLDPSSHGDDTLFGEAGNDTLSGGAGNDQIDGGEDNDLILGDGFNNESWVQSNSTAFDANDQLFGGAGSDTVLGQNGSDTIDGGADNDFLYGGIGNDTIRGGTGNDIVSGEDGNDRLEGGTGNDILNGGYGTDILLGGAGDDTLTAGIGNGSGLSGDGDTSNNILFGGDGDDDLFGGSGNDTLDGGAGFDFLQGGDGDDVYVIGPGSQGDVIFDESGNNTIQLADIALESLAYEDFTTTYIDAETNEEVTSERTIIAWGDYSESNRVYIDNASLGSLNLQLNTQTVSVIDAKGGFSQARQTGAEGGAITGGVLKDRLSGNVGNDTLTGYFGNDTLTQGLGGNDTLIGGFDNDTYIISDASTVTIVEGASEGSADKVVLMNGNDYVLADNVEILEIVTTNDPGAARAVGNSASNIIYGAADRTNTLEGAEGGDTLYGGGEDDVLFGYRNIPGTTIGGSDTLFGGAGNDTLHSWGGIGNVLSGDAGNDIFDVRGGNATAAGGVGNDLFIIRSPDAVLTIQNDGDAVGNDVLDGTTANASLLEVYRAGNDMIVVSDEGTAILKEQLTSPAATIDQIVMNNMTLNATQAAQAAINVNTAVYGTATADTLTGGSTSDLIVGGGGSDVIDAGTGNDHVYGATGNDTLRGGSGNDVLVGGAGNDTLIGGDGNDRFIYRGDSTGTQHDGSDVIDARDSSTSKNDVLIFQDTIPDDVILSAEGNNLRIELGNQQIVVIDCFLQPGSANGISAIEFSNGIIWNYNDIRIAAGLPGNSAPVAVGESYTIQEDSSLTVAIADLLANDTDAESNTLSLASIRVPDGLTVSQTNGQLIIIPKANFNGRAVIAYEVTDGNDTSNTVELIINVTPVNDVLATYPDQDITIVSGETTYIPFSQLTGNDIDVDGDELYVESASDIRNELDVSIDRENQQLIIKPKSGFDGGRAGFSYRISDGNVSQHTASVDVYVLTPERTGILVCNEDSTFLIDSAQLLGDAQSRFGGIIDAVNGVAWYDALNDSIQFKPNSNFSGAASFSYYVSEDGYVRTETANVLVTPQEDELQIYTEEITCYRNSQLAISFDDLLGYVINKDNRSLEITNVTSALGAITVDYVSRLVTFIPPQDHTGPALFSFSISDGLQQLEVPVSINVKSLDSITADQIEIGSLEIEILKVAETTTSSYIDTQGGNDRIYVAGVTDPVTLEWHGGTGDDRFGPDWLNAGSLASLTLYGGLGSDYISHPGAGGTYIGGAGEDTLSLLTIYNQGGYTLIGGEGDDTYVIGDITATIIESNSALSGVDTVYWGNFRSQYQQFVLPENVENLKIQGMYQGNVVRGNDLDNLIATATAYDPDGDPFITIDGGVGADVMIGNCGLWWHPSEPTYYLYDVFYVDNINDVVIELGAGAEIRSTVDGYTLGKNAKRLFLNGSEAIRGFGNAEDNALYGNHNPIANTLYGGDGNDTYYLGGNDSAVEHENSGVDTLIFELGGTYTLSENIENVRLSYYGNIIGNALDNTITGGGGLNTIIGGDGNDYLIGVGDDLAGGSGDDIYIVGSNTVLRSNADLQGYDIVRLSYIAPEVTFSKSGDALLINRTVSGSSSIQATIEGFFNGQNKIEEIQAQGGAWTANQIFAIFGVPVTDSAPEAVSDHFTVSEDLFIDIPFSDLLENDTDDSSSLTIQSISAMLNGSATIDYINKHIRFTPTKDYSGPAQFTYTISDGFSTVSSVAQLTVSAKNDAPLLGIQSVTGVEDNTIVLRIDDVLAGAIDADGDLLSIVSVSDANGGSVVIDDENGWLVFTPTADFNGLATFNFSVSDGTAVRSVRTNIAIQAREDAPVVVDDLFSTLKDLPLTISESQLVSNDLETDGQNLTVTGVTGSVGGAFNFNATTRSIVFTPQAGFVGQASFRYMLTDGITSTEGVAIINVNSSSITGTESSDSLQGTLGSDELYGFGGDDVLRGDNGNDSLSGGLGADSMVGGAGDDTYIIDNIGDVVSESSSAGTADLVRSGISYTLGLNVENLTLTGTSSTNATGNSLANILIGNQAANILNGMGGTDTMIGGEGDDSYVVDNIDDVVTELDNEGLDSISSGVAYTLATNVENLVLTGSGSVSGTGNSLNNTITGNSGVNVLIGGGGNDVLNGGAGADSLIGGIGDDVYTVDNAGDILVEHADEGFDVVYSSATHSLANNIENLVLTGTSSVNGTGNSFGNTLVGNTGANTLAGGDGSDLLDGSGGADRLIGGTGDDAYVVDHSGDVIVEVVGEGIDTVNSAVTFVLASEVENLTLVGTSASNGTGNALSNLIIGNSAVNTLDGGLGVDTLAAGDGDDIYLVDNAADVITESIGGGIDTVRSAIEWTLAENVENLVLTGTSANSGYGNVSNNSLMGNSGVNTLVGGAGSDLLDGGVGADRLVGGSDNDIYVVDSVGDVVSENVNEGVDTVNSSVTYTLSENVENLTLTGTSAINANGNILDNILTGNSGVNTLDGGAGIDTLSGDIGNDVYIIADSGDVIVENSNAGTDAVLSSASYSLAENIENLTLTGAVDANGAGNSLNNVLIGNVGINTILGGEGNDTLDGGSAADSLIGGTGDDLYITDLSDVVVESADAGIDTIRSAQTYSLGSNVENLVLTGSAAANGTGNLLNNVITGNTGINTLDGGMGNDVLDGGSGADRLIGGVGDDSYFVDSTSDIVVEAAGEGADTVNSSVTHTLSSEVENLTLLGSGAINAIGNGLSNDITGNGAVNTLDGGAGIDMLRGGAGDDVYLVNDVLDIIIEGANAGTDTIRSSVAYSLESIANVENLTLTGSSAIAATGNSLDNTLTGNSTGNTLNGGAGNDVFAGGGGADTFIGGIGNDIYTIDSLDDVVIENGSEGSDTANSSIALVLGNNIENLVLTGTAGLSGAGNDLDNAITGNSGANTLTGGAGNDALNGGTGADRLIGGVGNDSYFIDNVGDVIEEAANEGIDTVNSSMTHSLAVEIESLTLIGTSAINGTGNSSANTLIGNSSTNTLVGNAGNDLLDGGAGIDTLFGGAGDDIYVVDHASDVVSEIADDGVDIVNSNVTYTLASNLENLVLVGTSAINATGNALNNHLMGNSAANTLNGDVGADILAGGLGNDTYVIDNIADVVTENSGEGADLVSSSISYSLTENVENLTLVGALSLNATGNALTNVLTGNSAANTLDGGAGVDTLIGGAGDDIYLVDGAGDVITEVTGAGNDSIISTQAFSLASYANIENLVLTGVSALTATGNSLSNVITGNVIANTLDGGAGADTLIGGAGDDIYMLDNVADVVVENANEGIDLVIGSVTTTLAANVENLTLSGSGAIHGTGNGLANILLGNSGVNTLVAGAGNDSLNGGQGADILMGGMGDDVYFVDNASEVITEYVGEGIDQVFSSATFTLSSNADNLTLTGSAAINATGNLLVNVLMGNAMANILDGGVGADTLIGGAGNDTYLVDNSGDVVEELNGEGTDLVSSAITYTLGENLENLTLTGSFAGIATGNALANIVTGNVAANTLDGGEGADSLIGGAGDDLYIVEAAGDVVTELANAGVDTVRSSVTYSLLVNIENLTLTGLEAINGTGNTAINMIVGNAADNTLNGGSGADTLMGGAGNDVYIVDNMADVIAEIAGEGDDIVYSSANYSLGNNIEQLIITGGSSNDAVGNSLNNTLRGNAANNTLDGGSGDDTLIGGAGNDVYIIDQVGDIVVELSAEGTDHVRSASSYTLGENLENLTLTGTSANNATGNVQANTLTGNSAANILNGGSGADVLVGGAGDDIYVVDSAADVVSEATDAGTDTINSSVTYTLLSNVENLTLTGSSAIDATGNSSNNTLVGNSGNNSLNGGIGADTLIGGAGNDTYYIDDIADVVIESAGGGDDTVMAAVTYTLVSASNIERLRLFGNGAINATGNALANVLRGNGFSNTLDGGEGVDTLIGGLGDDVYIVDVLAEVIIEAAEEGIDVINSSVTHSLAVNVENLLLTGNAQTNGTGNALGNVLTGNTNANTLDGGAGIDTLIGGLGDDTYIVDDVQDLVIEDLGGGIDTITGSEYSLVDHIHVENLTLAANRSYGVGNDLGNVITGNVLANELDGGAGNDTLIGGAGDDVYWVDTASDVIVENSNEGTETVNSLVTYSLAATLENLTLLGNSALNGTGNALGNILTGNSGVNTLVGNAGNDVLVGGTGADRMEGGADDDSYFIDNISDVVVENTSQGIDTVNSSITFSLSSLVNVENLTLMGTSATNATGNSLNNVMIGNSGNNTLDGGTGADTLQGGIGNDVYVVDNTADIVTEISEEGSDRVQSAVSYGLGANIENLTLSGSSSINGTGNALNNTLIGNTGVNTLTGGDGNDSLDGGTDADRLVGGLGDDNFVVDNASDAIVENSAEGMDSVRSSVTYTLVSNVEHLTLTGSSALNGTGNAENNTLTGNSGANTLTGNAGNDVLNGGSGADRMVGGANNDIYFVDNVSDVVVELAGEGTDTVNSSITFSISSLTNIENLEVTGTSAINATGNSLDNTLIGNSGVNTLTGNAGHDVLDGDAGADRMVGGSGNDSYFIDNTGDVVVENASEGTDSVISLVTFSLSSLANVENVTLVGASAINATGNAIANILIGNSGANTLSGAAGNDTLTGGAGNDSLDGGAGNDVYQFNTGFGADTLSNLDAVAGTVDKANFVDANANTLWFSHVGNNLVINTVGTNDQVTIANWYSSADNQVEQIQAGSEVLLNSQVEQLVSIMANYAVPSGAGNIIPQAAQDALAPVIAEVWNAA